MEGKGMNENAVLKKKDYERPELFAIPDLAGKIFTEAKSLAEEKGVHPTSQLRSAVRAVLVANLGEDLAHQVINSPDYIKLITAANSLIADERKKEDNNKSNKYIVPQTSSPQQTSGFVSQVNTSQQQPMTLKTGQVRQPFTPRKRVVSVEEAEKARHEPQQSELVMENGKWVQKNLI
jgi:hypothetical protein